MLIVSLLVLSACAGFAVIMTNGPDYRAAAQPAAIEAEAELTLGGVGPGAALAFSVDLADGPVVIGRPGRLIVTVRNLTDDPVTVDDLGVEVLQPSRPGCRAEWLSVGPLPGADRVVAVPARGAVPITLPYTLVDLAGTNQDACQGATFPLSITGTGRPV